MIGNMRDFGAGFVTVGDTRLSTRRVSEWAEWDQVGRVVVYDTADGIVSGSERGPFLIRRR